MRANEMVPQPKTLTPPWVGAQHAAPQRRQVRAGEGGR